MSIITKMRLRRKASLRGRVEGISGGLVFGWAVSRSHPESPAQIEVLIDDVPVGKLETSRRRPDNATAAASGYRCGFTFDLRPHLRELRGQKIAVRDALTGDLLGGSTIILTPGYISGRLDGVSGTDVFGWAVTAAPGDIDAEVEILIDGVVAGVARAHESRADLRLAGVPRLNTGFRFAVPSRWLDGQRHTVTARARGSTESLQGGAFAFIARIMGHIDHFSRERVSGWLVNLSDLEHPPRFDLWVNERCIARSVRPNLPRTDVYESLAPEVHKSTAAAGFDVALPAGTQWFPHGNRLSLRIPGSVDNLLGKDFFSVDRVAILQKLGSLTHQLLQEGDPQMAPLPDAALTIGLRDQLQKAIGAARKAIHQPHVVPVSSVQARSNPVDVIIPVYKGLTETVNCIRSVLAARVDTAMELIVINDCSPDSALTAELRRLAASERFTLVENAENIGFVGTVNRGMKLHSDRDVVLLNSDTLVPNGWLDGLKRAAYAEPGIGTVTPMSNRATIFSLPRACVDNEMPLGLGVEELNELCAANNAGTIVDVPTAMGFCMYIRRSVLDEVGYFDEQRWAKGYGEENDFSMQAASLGWRNIAACDVFVQHLGNVSFGQEKPQRVQENLAKLNALYPEYPHLINRFIANDPLAIPRGRVNVALLGRLAQRWILFVSHGLNGGTETAIRDLCEQHRANGRSILILRSTPSGRIELAPAKSEFENTIVAEYPHDTSPEVLAEQLSRLNIEFVHFHHSLGFGRTIWRLPELLGVPFDVMIHDFYLACPRITMIDESGMYCGQPQIAACERCVRRAPLDHDVADRLDEIGGTVEAWRKFHADQLCRAREVSAPSQDTVRRLQRYFPERPIEARPHHEPSYVFEARRSDGSLPYRIAVIGAIGPHKGVDLLLACARYALREDLPIRFTIIGYTNRDADFLELDNVEITGRYDAAELPVLVESSGCTVALFLSVWPETFSYTLSEAWRCGLTPVSLDIGAQAERIREQGIGRIVPFPATPSQIIDALIETAQKQSGVIESDVFSHAQSIEDHEG